MRKKFLTREQMDNLTTRNLLAYLRSLQKKYHDKPDWEDDVCSPYKVTKSTPEWQEAHDIAKEILSKREHIERGFLRKGELK